MQPNQIARILTDTGACCRDLLGYNYDEDDLGHRINRGSGGIRASGKTQEIIDLLDDPALRYKLILAPRGARKSSIAQGFVLRNLLCNPNIRICYIGRTDAIVRGKASAIRNQIVSPAVRELFGDLRGEKWEEMCFTIASRTEHGLTDPTFTAFSMESFQTGGRYDLIVCDDIIDQDSVATQDQNKKSKDRFAQMQPFLAPGGVLVLLGTRWDDDDLYYDLQASRLFSPPLGGQIVCGSGVEVIRDSTGKFDLAVLKEGLTFPHLTLDHLRQKLFGMVTEGKTRHFILQYLNETSAQGSGIWQRKFFRPLLWGHDMEKLSGYLLTDTAISEEIEACYSVVAYVGLDASDNIYLLDLRVGQWDPTEFVNQFFTVLETWVPKVNHCGEAWEKVSLSMSYRSAVENDSRSRRIKLRAIEMPRPPQSHKLTRIGRLHHPMQNKQFYVVDTVPRTFQDAEGEKELWNPIGFWNAQMKAFEPSGELVDEFIKLGKTKRDIPDAIAMILEYEKVRTGYRRYCTYKAWAPKARAVSLTEQRQRAYDQEERRSDGTDWWSDTLREHGY